MAITTVKSVPNTIVKEVPGLKIKVEIDASATAEYVADKVFDLVYFSMVFVQTFIHGRTKAHTDAVKELKYQVNFAAWCFAVTAYERLMKIADAVDLEYHNIKHLWLRTGGRYVTSAKRLVLGDIYYG